MAFFLGKKEPIASENLVHTVLTSTGGTCSSCAHTIEHVGKKFKGIQDVEVDRVKAEIHVDYDGKKESIDQIIELIRRIGYEAKVK